MKLAIILPIARIGHAMGKNLYVANYAGPLSRLSFTRHENATFSLSEQATTRDCGLNPGWLQLDKTSDVLYCLNEAYTVPNAGSLSLFNAQTLTLLDNITTDYGPAQSTWVAPNRLGIAHYAGGAVSVIDTSTHSALREVQSFHYFLDTPGPNTTLQDNSYPHGIVLDPTGEYAVVLDRGADVLRIYSSGWDGRLDELGEIGVEKGNGPRHGVFVTGKGGKTFFYVLGELKNSLMGFEVLYPTGRTSADQQPIDERSGLSFRQIYNASSYGTPFGDHAGIALPAEIVAAVSPSGAVHLVLSTRNDGLQTYLNEPSDTIVSFGVGLETGTLTLIGLTASGGRWPRTFAVSADGRFVAVANQYTVPGRLVVFARDQETGVIEDVRALATWNTDIMLPDGQSISHILWDE